MLLQAENTSAIVIDVQERLMPVMSDKEVLEKNICTLIRGLKTLDIPMVVTQQYTKGIGMTIPSVREALESDDYFDKKSFSCYGDPAVKEAVDKLGRKEVLVFGIEAHICVLQTCLELAEKNGVKSIALCCISTGEYRFPQAQAAKIAVQTVKNYREQTHSKIEVIFNVFKERDNILYRNLLGANP